MLAGKGVPSPNQFRKNPESGSKKPPLPVLVESRRGAPALGVRSSCFRRIPPLWSACPQPVFPSFPSHRHVLAVLAGFSASLVEENKDVILKRGDKVAKLSSVFPDRIQEVDISGNMFSQIRERSSSTGGKPSDSQIFMRLATSDWETESPEIPRITAQAPSRNQTLAEEA